MYLPPHFREDRLDVQHALMRAYPLGLLVIALPQGLSANPLPFLLYAQDGTLGTLRGHVSRANPLWRELADAGECLVVFQGPDAYITPSWYATKRDTGKVVPTWNYAAVHAWGLPRAVDDPQWLRRLLRDLTHAQERERPAPWGIEDAPAEFIEAQLRGIVGVEIPVRRIEGKWKASQNRTPADRAGVIEGLKGEGESGLAMSRLVAERGAPG